MRKKARAHLRRNARLAGKVVEKGENPPEGLEARIPWGAQIVTIRNLNFWHTFRTINLAGGGIRLKGRVPLLFHFNKDGPSTEGG